MLYARIERFLYEHNYVMGHFLRFCKTFYFTTQLFRKYNYEKFKYKSNDYKSFAQIFLYSMCLNVIPFVIKYQLFICIHYKLQKTLVLTKVTKLQKRSFTNQKTFLTGALKTFCKR